MRKTLNAALTLLFVAAVAGCGDDDPTDPGDESRFVGSFEASSMIFTPDATGNPVDVIPFGASLSVDVESDLDFTWTLTAPGGAQDVRSGILVVNESSSTATLNFDSAEHDDITGTYDFSNNDNTLTLQSDDVEFDVNQDGVDDPASVQVILQRQ